MSDLYLWDDAVARRFEPYAHTRPVCELRVGAWLLRERWERGAGTRAAGILTSDHLADFEEPDAPPVHRDLIPAGAIVVNSRCALDATAALNVNEGVVWLVDGRVAALRLAEPRTQAELPAVFEAARSPSAQSLRGRWIDAVWELVSSLPDTLTDDLLTLAREQHESLSRPESIPIVGEHPVLAAWNATIEPFVVIDATDGPVVLLEGSRVGAFSRLAGPLLLGHDSTIVAGSVRCSSIGEWSKVHGELSHTVVLGHANKSHDGFVGHSYMGRWVNLGSGTTTSNLKNTYGSVTIWTPDGIRNTGMQFLGTLFGDHVKTGIGLMLTTGCVLGAGANLFGVMPPKAVSPFAWGGAPPYSIYEVEKFLDVCTRVMARRNVTLNDNGRRHLTSLHVTRWDFGS